MENSNLSIQLPLVLIRATENVKKNLQCISESNAVQLLGLVYTVYKETFNGLFDNPVLLAGTGFHLCRQHRHTQVYSTQTNLEYKPESLRLALVYSDILEKKLFTVLSLAKVQRLPP